MTLITVKLMAADWRLLASLASDQLFRREFIDPRMPGNRSNPAEVTQGKKLVERLRLAAEGSYGKRTPQAGKNGAPA